MEQIAKISKYVMKHKGVNMHLDEQVAWLEAEIKEEGEQQDDLHFGHSSRLDENDHCL